MLRSTVVAPLSLALLLLTPSLSEARSFRVNQVPNGSQFGCVLCHANANGGGPRNGFGSQVETTMVGNNRATADVDWAAIFDEDGDSDGYSNGRELGDPDGTWTIGDPNPDGPAYEPYNRTDSPCGDGVLENPPEECDGTELPEDVTCETLGYGPGTLSCSSTCRINAEQCEGFETPNNDTPTNNANNDTPTNNATNGTTNNATNNPTNNSSTTGTATDDDDGGCSTASGAGNAWTLVFAFFGFRRLRRLTR